MIGKSTNTPASTPCMANDNAAVHGFRLLKVPLDSTRLSSNIPALLVFTTDTGNSKLAPAIGHDCAAVDSERTDGLVAIWRVESRTGAVAVVFRWRLDWAFASSASIRFDRALFPVPAHRTGQADFPHPALGKDAHRTNAVCNAACNV